VIFRYSALPQIERSLIAQEARKIARVASLEDAPRESRKTDLELSNFEGSIFNQ